MRQSQRFNQTKQFPSFGRKPSGGSAADGGVLLAATELFVARSRHDIEEQEIFSELARNLISATSTEDRRRIASLLAPHAETPDDLLQHLARHSDHLTAYPALRYSARLSVDLLQKTAFSGPDTLRQAIANRASLPESIVTSLCENAGSSVIRILLDRNDVLLTQRQKSVLNNRQDIVADLSAEMAHQDALNPEALMGQFLQLPSKLKSKAIAAAEMTSLVSQAQAPRKSRDTRTDAARLQLCDALVQEALTQNRPRFADLLSQGLGLPLATCDQLTQADQADGLAVALKALGTSKSQLATVLIRLHGEAASLETIRLLLRLHQTISSGASEVLVSQWVLSDQPEFTSAVRHAPLYEAGKKHQSVGEKGLPFQENSLEQKSSGN